MSVQKDGHKYLISENGKGDRIYVYWEEYNCKWLLHVRGWYNANKNKPGALPDWRPGKYGVAFPAEKIQAFLTALQFCLKEGPFKPVEEASHA